MRRGFGQRLVYVLIAALLLAQQGLALHAVSHGLEALKIAKQGPADPRGVPADRSCDLCLTYAQVAAGAAATPLHLTAQVGPFAIPGEPVVDSRAAFRRAYRSRAPPRVI